MALGSSWQIVRAEAGAVPLYTDDDAQAETIGASRAGLGWAALVCALAAALLFALQARLSAQGNVPGSWACLAACAVFALSLIHISYGGAPLLGVKGALLVGHGSSNALAVKNGVLTTARIARTGVSDIIAQTVATPCAAEATEGE